MFESKIMPPSAGYILLGSSASARLALSLVHEAPRFVHEALRFVPEALRFVPEWLPAR
jgi:hypothetical protein